MIAILANANAAKRAARSAAFAAIGATTWTVPAGVTSVTLHLVGAGSDTAGGGYGRWEGLAVTPGAAFDVTVGDPGSLTTFVDNGDGGGAGYFFSGTYADGATPGTATSDSGPAPTVVRDGSGTGPSGWTLDGRAGGYGDATRNGYVLITW